MLATSARVRPWNARVCRSSFGRSTSNCSPSWRTEMSPGSSQFSEPLGPLTSRTRPESLMETPVGTGIGALPIRDIVASPHVTDDFAADAFFTRIAVGHQSLARRNNRYSETTQHSGDLAGFCVHPQARRRDALDTVDHTLAVDVFHVDRERLGRAAVLVDAET